MSGTTRLALGLLLLAAKPVSAQKPARTEMRAHFIEVGQANATVLEFSCGVIMIDAGFQRVTDKLRLLAYLDTVFARRGDATKTIETLFITHNHADHTKALNEIVKRFKVKHIISGGIKPLQRASGPASVAPRQIDDDDVQGPIGLTDEEIDPVACAGIDPDIVILSGRVKVNPGWGKSFSNENNHSLVIRVDFGSSSFLFTGDMEEQALGALVAYWDENGKRLDTDLYHSGHHGARNATTAALMDAVTPELAVISMGRCDKDANGTIPNGPGNSWQYGHPTDTAVRLMIGAVKQSRESTTVWVSNTATKGREFRQLMNSAAVFGTGWDGHVVVKATNRREYEVTVQQTSEPPACTQNVPPAKVSAGRKP